MLKHAQEKKNIVILHTVLSFCPVQIYWILFRTTTLFWMRYRSVWKLIWSQRESFSPGTLCH